MMDMLEAIESLHERSTYYYIDYIPHNPESPAYLELEEYYDKTYLHTFADKISRVMLQLMWQYPCRVCLGEAAKQIGKYNEILPFTDIRHYSPEQLADIIKTVIVEDFNQLSILFFDVKALISIDGGFQVVLYHTSEDMVAFVKQLCQAEGLFLKYKAEDGGRVMVMSYEALQQEYVALKQEVENLRYHFDLMQMMLPDDSKYAFFQYVLTSDLSKVEVAKILKALMKMNDEMKGREFPDELYTVGDEPVLFDTSLPMEQWGKEFVRYVNTLFNGKVNPLHLLKACKMQGVYQEACTMLLEQIE